MRILVNGVWRESGAAGLDRLLAELGYQEAVVSTAVNGEFVATGARAGTRLADGDRVEVLAPMQGG
ncbi:MAG: sulfur carrier protein ThiS [Steroidobacterales bacterium]|jgi:sulfur carrier protein